MYFLFVCWFISRLLYPKPGKTLASVIPRHQVFATRYGPINTRPRSAPGSRSLLLTVSDAATVACSLAGARVIQRELLRHDRW